MHNSPILTLKGVSKPLSKFLFSTHDMVKVLIGPQKCTPSRIIQTVASFGDLVCFKGFAMRTVSIDPTVPIERRGFATYNG